MEEFDAQQYWLDQQDPRQMIQYHPGYRALRSQANVQGGVLLLYKGIMNLMVIVAVFAATLAQMMGMLFSSGGDADAMMNIDMDALMGNMMASMGLGYLMAVLIGWVILRIWKGNDYFRYEIYRKGAPMPFVTFLCLVCLTFGCQLPAQLMSMGLEWVSNLLGGSLTEVMQENGADTDALPMWLYVCLAAPVTEELLFRGLLLRSIAPFGKKFAIVVTAVLFGLYHGNPIQTPYAFLVGLILGYVAMEYNVIWAMILHMMNNLLLSDSLPRLLQLLPYQLSEVIMWVILILFFLASAIILLLKWRTILQRNREEVVESWQNQAFWKSPCVILVCVWSILDIGMVCVMALRV